MVPFPVTLSDGLNYIWDFQNKGGINRGSNAVFDGAFLNLDLPNVTQAQESLGGRMFTLSGDSRYFQDIALSRSVYVPDNAGWVRFVDTATNTGDTAKFYNFRIYSDFGADVRTQIAASGDGNLTLGLNDDWALINGTDAPSVGVVWGNDSADALTPTEAWLANDDLAVGWTVTLQPGETLSILHFALQDHDETRLQSNIDALSGELTAEMLAGLDFDTMDSIANFDLGELVAPQTLYFGNGSDDVLMGAEADETYEASGGDDVVLAMGGNDTVHAGSGADTVLAGAGADLVLGHAGDDVLIGGDGDDRLEGDGTRGTTGNAQAAIAETGRDLAVSVRLPESAPGQTVRVEGMIAREAMRLDDLRLVFLVDESSSMTQLLPDTSIGDRDGNGIANEAIDGMIAAFAHLSDSLTAAGFAGAELTVIGFDSDAQTLYSGLVGGAVEEALGALSPGGGTSFAEALRATQEALGPGTGGDVMISVLSDGFPDDDWNTDGFDAMAAALRDPAGLNATIRTIGVGSTAGTADLDRIDDGAINGSVSVATTLAELNAALMATPVDRAEVAALSFRVNGREMARLTSADLVETPMGLRFTAEIAGLTVGAQDVVEVVAIASDTDATEISVSMELAADPGQSGDDDLSGDEGNDMLFGNDGADVLIGGRGGDHLSGGAGGDMLVGGDGADALAGGAGDDTLLGGAGADHLHGGAGSGDIVSYAGSNAGVIVSLADSTASGGHADGDVISGFEGIEGSSFDDFLTGDASDNVLRPGLGEDHVYGGDGFDIVDYSSADSGVSVNITTKAGWHILNLTQRDWLDSVEGARGSQFRDKLYGTGWHDFLDGGDGNDVIRGYIGNDILHGGAGADWLEAAAGHDTAYGGAGDDRLRLGEGNDLGWGDDGDDDMEGGAGDDTFWGGSGDDMLEGMADSDTLYGEAGDDALFGGSEADDLHGGSGKDRLDGGDGDDILNGGTGNDRLFGGLGNDVFVFEDNFGFDEVRDFDRGDNVLDLQSLHLVDFDDFIRHAEQKTSGVKFVFETGDGFFMGGMVIADLEAGDVIL